MRPTIQRRQMVQNATNNYKHCYIDLVKKEVKSFLFHILKEFHPWRRLDIL